MKSHGSSKKEIIREYVIDFIKKSDKDLNDTIIPSETFISRKFDVSRETVRGALIKLVYSGIISPVKGKGYVASSDIINFNYNFNTDISELKTQVELIPNKSYFNSIEKTFTYTKKYKKGNTTVAWSLCAVNKEIVYNISKAEVKKGLINFLIKNNYDLFKIEKVVEFYDIGDENSPFYKTLKDFKIKLLGRVPISFTRLYDKQNNLLEVSIVIINPEYYRTRQNIFL